jgi:hypothetical protein
VIGGIVVCTPLIGENDEILADFDHRIKPSIKHFIWNQKGLIDFSVCAQLSIADTQRMINRILMGRRNG